jgi:hypothetical protein
LLVWSSRKVEEYLPLQWNLFPTNFVLFYWPKELWFFLDLFGLSRYYSFFLSFFEFFYQKFYVTKLGKKEKKTLTTLCQELCACFVSFQSDLFSFFGVMGLSDWSNTPKKKHTFSHCSQHRRLCNLPLWFPS